MKLFTSFICLTLIWLISLLALTGCSTSYTGPTTLSNGKTYFINSDSCALFIIQKDNTTISCFDKNNNFTGTAQPMSPETIANYHNMIQLQQQEDALRRQRQADAINNSLNQMRKPIHCYTVGNMTSCY